MNTSPRLLLVAALLTLVACEGKQEVEKPQGPPPAPAARQKADAPPPRPVEQERVFFAYPQDGSKVFTTFDVAFGVQGKGVRPAGEDAADRSTGHHHLIIDGDSVPAGEVVPKDATHIHFGGGQTTTEVNLTPGNHKLVMQFADGAHLSYGPAMANSMGVTVVEGGEGRGVGFAEPADGAQIKGPVKVRFEVNGMKVIPAAEGDPMDKTTGHHHIIIDGGPVPLGQVVPKDDTHIHYGGGQTEAELKLSPGKHTLTAQFADAAHLSYGERMAKTITIEVAE